MRLEEILKQVSGTKQGTFVVAAPEDDAVIEAISDAQQCGLANFILVGDQNKMETLAKQQNADLRACEIIHETDHQKVAAISVRLIREQRAQALMKGSIHTAALMHAILDKENGIRAGKVLSSLTMIDSPKLDRMLFVTDPGIVPYPDFNQKVSLIQNAVSFVRMLGIETPKVAALAAVEDVTTNMPATLEAAALTVMNQRGQIKNCIVDGPLGTDNAIFEEAAARKGVKSVGNVAGHADILLVPCVEMGNGIMKIARYLAGCSTAGVLLGASAPVAMTSRADSAKNRLYTLAVTIAAANAKK